MKVWVDSERCQGHTLCSMIAPDSFQLNDIDGSSSAVTKWCRPIRRTRSGKPRSPARSKPSSSRTKAKGDSTLSVDDVVTTRQRSQEEPRITSTGTLAEYRSQFKTDHRGDARQVPDGLDRHLRRALGRGGSQEVFELARCPAVSNDHDINGERRGYQGISIPTANRVSGVRGGILEMDDPEHRIYRTVLNPYLSPAAVKRWEPFIDDVTRACLDEKIEAGQHRLRRRSGQHRARRADAGDAGHPAEELEPSTASRFMPRCTRRSTPPTSSASPRCTGRWASTWSTT